jgi:peptidylprolyl isomerase
MKKAFRLRTNLHWRFFALLTAFVTAQPGAEEVAEPLRSPYAIIEQAKETSWRDIDLKNTLVLTLESGEVVIELAPQFAPRHVANTKQLVRQGFYRGMNFYRVVDGFVAEGGDVSRIAPVGKAKRYVKSERFIKAELPFVAVDNKDGFAEQTGFVQGFPAARNSEGEHWMVHCPGVFAMGRNDDVDTGGTDFYIVIGHAPRYLDRNVTVYGKVVQGMQHVQALTRRTPVGEEVNTSYNPILAANIASDLPAEKRPQIQVMRTDSHDFAEIIASRRNRPENWFVERPQYVDVCGVPVPVRQRPAKE